MVAGSTDRCSTSTAAPITAEGGSSRAPRHGSDFMEQDGGGTHGNVACRRPSPPVAGAGGMTEAASGSQREVFGSPLPAIPDQPGRAGWRNSLAPRARCRSAKVSRLMQVTNRYAPERRCPRPRNHRVVRQYGPARSTEQDQQHHEKRDCAEARLEQKLELASADRGIDQFHDALPFILVRPSYRMNEVRSSTSCPQREHAA